MKFSDGGKVVEDKMLNALLEQNGFLAVFTGKKIFARWSEAPHTVSKLTTTKLQPAAVVAVMWALGDAFSARTKD